MPIAPEGHTYTRHMFKPVENSETGGCHADVYLPHTFGDSPCPTGRERHSSLLTDHQHWYAMAGALSPVTPL